VAKRVSLKGRGADIFFGDYGPTAEPAVPTPAPEAVPVTAEDMGATDEPEATPPGPEQTPEGSESGRRSERRRSPAVSKHQSLQASKQASKLASLQSQQKENVPDQTPLDVQASKLASMHTSTSVGQRGQESASHADDRTGASDRSEGDDPAAGGGDAEDFLAEIGEVGGEFWTRVDAPATITSSFRYTEPELTALTDVLYEIGKQYGVRVTKQDVVRLALNAVLNEYYQQGPSSLLGRLAARRQRHTGGR
jgi:hypothetical protein